jgi:HAD superfamily hydrolase (TIGR01490 family)
MALALFDLDNTLLAGDSDHAWNEFLIQEGAAGRDFREGNDRFYADYVQGKLDMLAYLRFAVGPLNALSGQELEKLRQRFLQEKGAPMILPKGRELLAEHRERGDTLVILTATNSFVTRPLARMLGVDDLLATELETEQDRFTGEPAGLPCYREGKVTRLLEWMNAHGHTLESSHFYTDSHNDLPLLNLVDHPVAVDPDSTLAAIARQRGWPVMSLR